MATHKQEKRKGFEWFRTLTKKQQKQFRKNVLKESNQMDFVRRMNKICTFSNFIGAAFTWVFTPEGDVYWFNISNLKK